VHVCYYDNELSLFRAILTVLNFNLFLPDLFKVPRLRRLHDGRFIQTLLCQQPLPITDCTLCVRSSSVNITEAILLTPQLHVSDAEFRQSVAPDFGRPGRPLAIQSLPPNNYIILPLAERILFPSVIRFYLIGGSVDKREYS